MKFSGSKKKTAVLLTGKTPATAAAGTQLVI